MRKIRLNNLYLAYRILGHTAFTRKILKRIIKSRVESYGSYAIALDFDGVVTKENTFPEISPPNFKVISAVRFLHSQGVKFVLYTCREGDTLQEAKWFCARHNVPYDKANENLEERIIKYQNDSRKIGADEYWDDMSINYWN